MEGAADVFMRGPPWFVRAKLALGGEVIGRSVADGGTGVGMDPAGGVNVLKSTICGTPAATAELLMEFCHATYILINAIFVASL